MYIGNPRVKTISVPDVDPVTGESNFDYEYGGFTKEFFADQQLLMDEISYRCLYKQEPIEREGLLFPDDKIRRYLNLPHGEPEIVTAQCDTKGKGTDYFVMPVLQKYGDDYYCVDCVCDNTADYEMQYENASNILVNNQVQECEFERNAGGDRVAMEVNKRVENKGWICNITDVPTETNKEARIFQCSNWILQHIIFKDQSLYKPNEPYGVMMSLLKQYSVSGKRRVCMTTKDYLNQISRLNRMINNKLAEISQLRELSHSILAVKNEERVMVSSDPDKIGSTYAKIDEMEHNLDNMIDEYIEKKDLIIGQIDGIENEDCYNILFSRYIEKKTFEVIATEMKYSWRQIIRLHGKALKAFEEKYGNTYLKMS